jgi:hypothetical protein
MGDTIRIFGELMHVNNVREGSQLMQRLQGDSPFGPPFQRQDKIDCNTQENRVVDSGFNALRNVSHAPEPGGPFACNTGEQSNECGNSGDHQCHDENPAKNAQCVVGLA